MQRVAQLTRVKAVLAKLLGDLHEVALGVRDLVAQARLPGLGVGALELEVVVVETDDVDVGESSDLTGRSTDTAADVEDAHTRLEAHFQGEVVLVSSKLLSVTVSSSA